MKTLQPDAYKLKMICYIYGIYIWTTPFLVKPELTNTYYSLATSFVSTAFYIYIMYHFKDALNIYLHSVKMDMLIKYLMYLHIAGYSLNILAIKNPEGIFPYQAILGIGVIVLYIIYGFFLKNLDAPLEKLEKLKSLTLYSNCLLISIIMIFTIVGVMLFILLLGFSYFLLGNLFIELYNIDKDNYKS